MEKERKQQLSYLLVIVLLFTTVYASALMAEAATVYKIEDYSDSESGGTDAEHNFDISVNEDGNKTYKLKGDVLGGLMLTLENNETVILDGQGYTISGDSSNVMYDSTYALIVSGEGTLIIKNVTIEGGDSVGAGDSGATAMMVVGNVNTIFSGEAEIVINGGTMGDRGTSGPGYKGNSGLVFAGDTLQFEENTNVKITATDGGKGWNSYPIGANTEKNHIGGDGGDAFVYLGKRLSIAPSANINLVKGNAAPVREGEIRLHADKEITVLPSDPGISGNSIGYVGGLFPYSKMKAYGYTIGYYSLFDSSEAPHTTIVTKKVLDGSIKEGITYWYSDIIMKEMGLCGYISDLEKEEEDNYSFDGWYMDEELKYSISDNTILTVSYNEIPVTSDNMALPTAGGVLSTVSGNTVYTISENTILYAKYTKNITESDDSSQDDKLEGDDQTPEGGNGQTPEGGNGQTPGGGNGQTPGGGNGQTPEGGNGQTPEGGNGQTPEGGNGQTSVGGNSQIPGSGSGQNPDDSGQEQQIKLKKIKINVPSKKLAAGKKVKLSVNVTPKNASNKAVVWKVDKKKYASIDKKGNLTLKKKGIGKKIKVTAMAADGSGVKATCNIKIMKNAVKSIKLSAKNKTVKAGNKLTIKADIKTTGKSVNKTLKWTSSNTSYATVTQKGVVKTKKAGKGKKVTITAQSTDGSNKKAKIKLTIK